MTEIELVRRYFPKARGGEAGYILWNLTAYPICNLKHTKKQLAALQKAIGNTCKRGWRQKLNNEERKQDDEMCRVLADLRSSRP